MAYLWHEKKKEGNTQQVDSVSAMNVKGAADYVLNPKHFMEESFLPCRMLKSRGFRGRQKNLTACSESRLCVGNMHISQTV